jgi:outer membrane protein OmpA-like peptidoglycan-associated protein
MWRKKVPLWGLVLGMAVTTPLTVWGQAGSPSPTGSGTAAPGGGTTPEPGMPTPSAGGATTPGSTTSGSTASGSTQSEPTCEVATVVEFKPSSAKLTADAKANLDRVALGSKDKASQTFRLRGPAITGSPSSSKTKKAVRLTARRSDAIKSYLASAGVSPMAITSTVTGEGGVPPLENVQGLEVMSCMAPVASAEPSAPPETPPPPVVVVPVQPVPTPAPEAVPETPPAPPPPAPVATAPAPKGPMSRVGVGAMVGGGVTGFIDQEARNFTETGGSWEARASVGTRLPVALEAAYVGSAQTISALGLSEDTRLVGNGAEATARWNITRRAIQPYIFAGVGWDHYTLNNAGTNTSSLLGSDDVLTVPGGVGISFRLAQSLLLDLRGTARATFSDDLMNGPYASTGKEARLHNWNAGARLGWEF